jgi:imidazoleglycerol-phosphate dehydratase
MRNKQVETMATKPTDRRATIKRKTAETDIQLAIDLNGRGASEISTGVGFLDHMLTLFSKHGLVDLTVKAHGDLHIDPHHTVEDVGLCLGAALDEALGDKFGIRRYGDITLPMDETLVTVALDLSGRPFFVWKVEFPTEKIGNFDTQLVEEFWHAVTMRARMNFHVVLHHGHNSHHIAEAVFKAAARALSAAVQFDRRVKGVPSTKGHL